MLSRVSRIAVVVLLLVFALAAQDGPATPDSADKTVDLIWDFKIPMRDGIKLNGTVYKPHEQSTPLPVIFTLTPYISDSYHARALYFAQHGYAFVLVDVRGRGSSEGTFDPFAQEAHDGYDTVEFLAQQSWSNGKITMWGGSYAGYDQWAALGQLPPHLATIVPAAAAHPGVDFPFTGRVGVDYDVQWLTFTAGKTGNANLFAESAYWISKFRELFLGQKPFKSLDAICGAPSEVFQRWLQHPAYDDHWKSMSPSADAYAKIGVPILTITGDYDGDQPGALAYYAEHMQYGNAEAKARHYLIIGPWDHAGTRTPSKEVGGLTFGEASMLDLNKLHSEWYDWTLKGGSKPEFLKDHVAYYVIGPGAENWKYAPTLDAVTKERRPLYLTSKDGEANSAEHSGWLAAKPTPSGPDRYVYDPRDLRIAELENEDIKNSITDQRYALNLFGAGVVYHSEPFAEATELSGYVKLSVWMALDVPDTDISATLYEIMPDGTSVELTGDLIRARYRESQSQERLVTPGAINRYDFSGFTWFSRRVSRGSRLRLVIQANNSIQYEKNYNSGGVVAEESGKDARIAHVTIYHDAEHPSVLEIPIGR